MRAGGSLFVPVPNTVVELWGLDKGTQVQIQVTSDEMRITPVAMLSGRQVAEADLQKLWEVMKDVEVKVWLEDNGSSLKVQFTSPDTEVAKALAQNLRRALPAMLSMLGVRNRDTASE
jgi:antitoxin component of MazEF toxin-antitoxin module